MKTSNLQFVRDIVASQRRLFLFAFGFIGVIGIILLIWKVPQWEAKDIQDTT